MLTGLGYKFFTIHIFLLISNASFLFIYCCKPRKFEFFNNHAKPSNRLDSNLNVGVNFNISLNPNFVQSEFDEHLFGLQNEGYVILHQTWKSTCVLETKKKYMSSWQEIENDLKVVFWTDDTMEDIG